MNAPNTDPLIKQYREQISDNDLRILEAMNKRLRLVKSLREYKESQEIDFYDPAQEDWVITYLTRANRGPISAEGIRELFTLILQLTKREIAAPLTD